MKIGLIGFGKTGKSVASVLINEEVFTLEWVLRRNPAGNKEQHFQFMETGLAKPQLIFSKENTKYMTKI